MNVGNVGDLSIGQWVAVVRMWNEAHAPADAVAPPSLKEFEAAVMQARRLN